jgi:hypothetical protein
VLISKMRANELLLPARRVRYWLDYDPLTGVLTRRHNSHRCAAGAIYGRANGNGYLKSTLEGLTFYAHRVAWAHAHGCWPEFAIDHVDGNRANNRLSNLRVATWSQNNHHKKAIRAGLKGAFTAHTLASGELMWRSIIRIGGINTHLGVFTTEQAAHEEYCLAAARYFGVFARSE